MAFNFFKIILFLILLSIAAAIWYFNFYKKKKKKGSDYIWVGEGPDPFAKKEERQP